jgi:uncharacterized protein
VQYALISRRRTCLRAVLSEPIIDEVLEALAYPKVQRAARSKTDPPLWFEDLVVLSQLVGDDNTMQRISADSDDDTDIACAIAGRASFIVTGDPDLLDLRQHAGVRITTPREFVTVLQR